MSNQLTAEQQRKIEENRRKALERRAQRLGQAVSTDKQTSAGFGITSSHIQPQKHTGAPHPAALAPHSSVNALKRFMPPPQKQPQTLSNQRQGAQHQGLSGSGTQINNTNSGSSRQVRFFIFPHLLFGGNGAHCHLLSVFIDTRYWPSSLREESAWKQLCWRKHWSEPSSI